jgi:predicted alpha/beta hydrolase
VTGSACCVATALLAGSGAGIREARHGHRGGRGGRAPVRGALASRLRRGRAGAAVPARAGRAREPLRPFRAGAQYAGGGRRGARLARAGHQYAARGPRRGLWGYRELLELDLPAARAALEAQAPGRVWAIGGHSLGGQLAALAAALAPQAFAALVLVATGVPEANLFPRRQRWGVRVFARAIPLLTWLFGHFPGRHLRWAGTEAATLMRQWAGTVLTGRYDDVGIADAEARLRALRLPALAMRFTDDWLVSEASLRALVDKLGPASRTFEVVDGARLGDRPDHFRWLKSPAVPAAVIAGWLRVNP